MWLSSLLFGIGFCGQVIFLSLAWMDGYTLRVFPGLFGLTLFAGVIGMLVWIPCAILIVVTMFLKNTWNRQKFWCLLYLSVLFGTGIFIFTGDVKFQGMASKIEKHVDFETLHALGMRQLAGDTEGPEFTSYLSRYTREEIHVPVVLKEVWYSPPHDIGFISYNHLNEQHNEIVFIWRRFFGYDGILITAKENKPRKITDRRYSKISEGVYLVTQ